MLRLQPPDALPHLVEPLVGAGPRQPFVELGQGRLEAGGETLDDAPLLLGPFFGVAVQADLVGVGRDHLLQKRPATGRMIEKRSTPAGRAVYAERKWLSEAPYGWIKHVLGFQRFSLRGLVKVQGEWDLVCLAVNAKRLHVLTAA